MEEHVWLPRCEVAGILLSPQFQCTGRQATRGRRMKREYHRWHSPRLGMDMGVDVYGHWGPPLLGFPTSAGDEWELEHQGMIDSLADFIDGGKVKVFSINSINGLS